MRSSDLAPLLGQPGRADLGFHQGVVLTWNNETGENSIEAAGAVLTNVPCMNVTETLTMRPGFVVGLLRFKSTYFLLGRIVIPGSDEFFTGAQPNVTTPLYRTEVGAGAILHTQSSPDGFYYVKWIGGHWVHHRFSTFGWQYRLNGPGGTVGKVRWSWYNDISVLASSPGIERTTMHEITNINTLGVTRAGDFTYEWPADTFGKLVFPVYELGLTAGTGSGGNDPRIFNVPTFFTGHN